jgi:hypothetical protein
MRLSAAISSGLLAMLALACTDAAPTSTETGDTTGPAAPFPDVLIPGPPTTQLSRTIYGLDDQNTLVAFDGDRPGQVSRRVSVTGVTGTLVGIDFRPNDATPANGSGAGSLYAVSSAGGVYTIDLTTGAATLRSTLSVAPAGANFGVGFNPVPDRLRIHSDTEQNLRADVETGATIVDTPLAYAPGDVNFGRNPDVVATAYTNSVTPAPTTTELFAIDVAQDVLVRLNAPNNGQLTTVGRLVVDNGSQVGFDISGFAADRFGYATFTPPRYTRSFLYRVNLDNADRQPVGPIDHLRPIISLAIDDRTTMTVPISSSIVDPTGDFLPTYTGPQTQEVDVVSAEATYNGTVMVFSSTSAGPIGTTPGAFFVWGVNRGSGTARFPALAPGVLFDFVVVGRPDGTGTWTDLISGATAPLAAGTVLVTGSQLRITIPAALMLPRGFTFQQFTVNLWPRVGAGNNNQISDFAPDNSNAPVRVIP